MSAPTNTAAPHIPFYTPLQSPSTGTSLSPTPQTPTLFTPLTIRSLTFQNRIWVAPMCMYSASAGHLTDFHLAHLAAFAFRGASLAIIEATSVTPTGRITPEDSGLWLDSQIAPICRIADFVHSQGQKLGIQLAHAGRKASTVAPWLVEGRGKVITATEEVGGWPGEVVGASAVCWGEGYTVPKELTVREIGEIVGAFRESAGRALKAGVDVIEIHAAHGYLLSSFLSPISNRRTDKYGGSWENRVRLIVEVIQAIREVIPDSMPLLLRISVSEWMDGHELGSWDLDQTIRLAKILPGLGVDLLDCSSGGNNAQQKVVMHGDYQVGFAGKIREALKRDGIDRLLIGAVGMITDAEVAKSIVQEEKEEKKAVNGNGMIEIEDEDGRIAKADVVLVARQFLREPEWVLRVAHKLGVEVKWPNQYHRAQFPKGSIV